MTWTEIKRAISHGGTSSDLWECLYLLPDELVELLKYVKEAADHGWIHPMFCMAGYTGVSSVLKAGQNICEPPRLNPIRFGCTAGPLPGWCVHLSDLWMNACCGQEAGTLTFAKMARATGDAD